MLTHDNPTIGAKCVTIHAIAGAGGKRFLGPLPVLAKVDWQKPAKKGGNITKNCTVNSKIGLNEICGFIWCFIVYSAIYFSIQNLFSNSTKIMQNFHNLNKSQQSTQNPTIEVKPNNRSKTQQLK